MWVGAFVLEKNSKLWDWKLRARYSYSDAQLHAKQKLQIFKNNNNHQKRKKKISLIYLG